MKILQLRLIAFGPFRDRTLDLGDGNEGLHIIYGLNEAGKSAALRAAHQALYGIPERSRDNFIHPYQKLRVGALLRHSDGSKLEFVRRKGRDNTLRAADDKTPLEETSLQRFLGGVREELFTTLFGIDHERLVHGGQEIVRGAGRIGQTLFAAGTGISHLQSVLNQLQAEAEGLFKPSGQKPLINAAISQFKQTQRKLRDAQLPGQTWLEHEKTLRTAQETLARVDQELAEKKRARNRLERFRDALPEISRRNDLTEKLASYKDAVLLPEDFSERRQELTVALNVAKSEEQQALERLDKLAAALAGLEVPGRLLESGETVDQLHEELGSHRKASRDRSGLMIRKGILEGEAATILSRLPIAISWEELHRLCLGKERILDIQELGDQYGRLMERLEGIRNTASRLRNSIQTKEKRLQGLKTPKETMKLRNAVERIRKRGPLEEQYFSEKAEIEAMEASTELALSRQTLWSGRLEELEKLPLPSLETIDAFEKRMDEAQGRVRRLADEIEGIKQKMAEAEGLLNRIRLEREVPTEADLEAARARRDQGWRLVRRLWLEKKDGAQGLEDWPDFSAEPREIAEEYEAKVEQADRVADRLRREADRVAHKAHWLAEREILANRLKQVESGLNEAEEDLSRTVEEWEEVWEKIGLKPKSPREMRAWSLGIRHLAEQMANIRGRRSKIEGLRSEIDASRDLLGGILQVLGEPPVVEDETLLDLLARSEEVLLREDEIRAERKQLSDEIDRGRQELDEADSLLRRTQKDLSEWNTRWEGALRPLGLGRDASPAQANAVITDVTDALERIKEAHILAKRIEGIDRDAREFSSKVASVVEHLAEDLKARPVDQAVTEIYARLNKARAVKAEQKNLERQLRQEREKLRLAKKKTAQIMAQLRAMCEQAACSHYEDLQEAERRSKERKRLESEIERLEIHLHRLCAGLPLEDFVREAQSLDADSLEGEIERLGEEIRNLENQKASLHTTIGTEQNELRRMNGSADAAEFAEETQRIMATLERETQHYARLKLAHAALAQALERYRERHQGPILTRANDFFRRMTLGSFEGIRAEFNGKEEAVLVGVRQGGREVVSVEGMSDGSADQLYLALRLASLVTYLEESEPLPFIVDDVLVGFDDERTVAALEVLGEISHRTQVILFTHHRHLLELAENALDPKVLFMHTLERSGPLG